MLSGSWMLWIREHSLGMKPRAGLYRFPPEFRLCTQCQPGAAVGFPALLPPPINPRQHLPVLDLPWLLASCGRQAQINYTQPVDKVYLRERGFGRPICSLSLISASPMSYVLLPLGEGLVRCRCIKREIRDSPPHSLIPEVKVEY